MEMRKKKEIYEMVDVVLTIASWYIAAALCNLCGAAILTQPFRAKSIHETSQTSACGVFREWIGVVGDED